MSWLNWLDSTTQCSQAPICKGQIFEAGNDYSESVDDILKAVKEVSGAAGWKYREAANRTSPFSYSLPACLLVVMVG